MTPEAGVLVCGHISHIVKILYSLYPQAYIRQTSI